MNFFREDFDLPLPSDIFLTDCAKELIKKEPVSPPGFLEWLEERNFWGQEEILERIVAKEKSIPEAKAPPSVNTYSEVSSEACDDDESGAAFVSPLPPKKSATSLTDLTSDNLKKHESSSAGSLRDDEDASSAGSLPR